MMRRTEEEEFGEGEDEKEGGGCEGGGEGDGEEGGESLEDVVARWEAALGPKYKIIVSNNFSTFLPENSQKEFLSVKVKDWL